MDQLNREGEGIMKKFKIAWWMQVGMVVLSFVLAVVKGVLGNRILEIIHDVATKVAGHDAFEVPSVAWMIGNEMCDLMFGTALMALLLYCGYTGMTQRSFRRIGCWNCCMCWGACQAFFAILLLIFLSSAIPLVAEVAEKCDPIVCLSPEQKLTENTLDCLDSVPNPSNNVLPKECAGLVPLFVPCYDEEGDYDDVRTISSQIHESGGDTLREIAAHAKEVEENSNQGDSYVKHGLTRVEAKPHREETSKEVIETLEREFKKIEEREQPKIERLMQFVRIFHSPTSNLHVPYTAVQRRLSEVVPAVDRNCSVSVEVIRDFHIYVLAQPQLLKQINLDIGVHGAYFFLLFFSYSFAFAMGLRLYRYYSTYDDARFPLGRPVQLGRMGSTGLPILAEQEYLHDESFSPRVGDQA